MKKKVEGLFEGFRAGDLWVLGDDSGKAYPVLGQDASLHPVCWGGVVLGRIFRPSPELLAMGRPFRAKNYLGWRPFPRHRRAVARLLADVAGVDEAVGKARHLIGRLVSGRF